ncbi:MAG: DUF1648 domain-containing protein [Clostridia bacterium]
MKNPKLSVFPWRRLPYGTAALSLLLALGFCIAFFCMAQNLPETVPLHWSEYGGIDKWGPKSGLYHLPIISLVFGAVAFPSSVALIRRDLNGAAYFINGISLFVTCLMALVAAFFVSAAGA